MINQKIENIVNFIRKEDDVIWVKRIECNSFRTVGEKCVKKEKIVLDQEGLDVFLDELERLLSEDDDLEVLLDNSIPKAILTDR
ncbi:MAG: hypothetical protein OXL96_28205 [Candidatus Poribacteria bacterium]|nr:hypothetical protein [Candidatus Poribacteria bacterium]